MIAIAQPVEAWLVVFIPACAMISTYDRGSIAVSAEVWPVTSSVGGGLLMSSVSTSSSGSYTLLQYLLLGDRSNLSRNVLLIVS